LIELTSIRADAEGPGADIVGIVGCLTIDPNLFLEKMEAKRSSLLRMKMTNRWAG